MDALNVLVQRWRENAKVLERYRHKDTADRLRDRADELENALTSTDSLESGSRLLTTEQVAERLAVEPATVADWCREGRFPNATKTSGDAGEWRIPLGDVRKGPEVEKVEDRPDRVSLDVPS